MAGLSKWEGQAKGLLKAELKRKGDTYAELIEKLAEVGISETDPNIRIRFSRGKFTAAFLLACCEAIGSNPLRLY